MTHSPESISGLYPFILAPVNKLLGIILSEKTCRLILFTQKTAPSKGTVFYPASTGLLMAIFI